MTELTVLTFNIRHGLGTDDRLDLERIAGVIAEQGADVVALQEVDRCFDRRSDYVDQPGWLGERLGMTPVFGAQVHGPAGDGALPAPGYGCAVLTARPFVSSAFEPLPTGPEEEGRGLLQIALDVGGHTVRVGCVHLSHETAASRHHQAQEIGRLRAADSPALLLGDFNATPDSAEMRYLADRFVDPWPTRGCGPGFTFDSPGPWQRIDYILTSPDVATTAITVVDVDSASDHLAVRATVSIAPDS